MNRDTKPKYSAFIMKWAVIVSATCGFTIGAIFALIVHYLTTHL